MALKGIGRKLMGGRGVWKGRRNRPGEGAWGKGLGNRPVEKLGEGIWEIGPWRSLRKGLVK